MSDHYASPEVTRLMHSYEQALANEGILVSTQFKVVLFMCIGEPGSKVRKALDDFLVAADAEFREWSANEAYREAMMKD